MKHWVRQTALAGSHAARQNERWEYREGEKTLSSFDVDVCVGKKLDVTKLKGTSLDEIRDYAGFLKKTSDKLYGEKNDRRVLKACPCCGHAGQVRDSFPMFGASYAVCGQCGHAYVPSQPSEKALLATFSDSDEHSEVYTDPKTLEIRLSQIVQPKLDWVLEIYQKRFGYKPKSFVDVGAGGGHFVEICRRNGLAAEGYEISRSSRAFAKKAFGFDLKPDDFLADSTRIAEFDVMTFWGLLEYTPDPLAFFRRAKGLMGSSKGKLLIVEVPRFDCVGSVIQRECADTVARHLDPTSHVNCFSDASLATGLVDNGFAPAAAWYFGMDAYELLVQLALRHDGWSAAFEKWAPLIPALQAAMDSGRLCDDIIVAAVPR